eukprot:CAMPEP_0168394072 /NCGR_PEP_ID=MMETSP0228-20121227/19343_1 /TAXON_ID=133427 /ORGANISM="Protoceratium reticulatum, Strain CCCM 535 (=CCMP 1889)" /LENGTH=261 /DNA_ID=CAMNT_0008407469 /DNA_START=29 /DNA_END=811 /DNA_ORIENTATION=-
MATRQRLRRSADASRGVRPEAEEEEDAFASGSESSSASADQPARDRATAPPAGQGQRKPEKKVRDRPADAGGFRTGKLASDRMDEASRRGRRHEAKERENNKDGRPRRAEASREEDDEEDEEDEEDEDDEAEEDDDEEDDEDEEEEEESKPKKQEEEEEEEVKVPRDTRYFLHDTRGSSKESKDGGVEGEEQGRGAANAGRRTRPHAVDSEGPWLHDKYFELVERRDKQDTAPRHAAWQPPQRSWGREDWDGAWSGGWGGG